MDYIDTQFENYLQEELKIKRSLFNYHDTRIHICLYFIAPTGHSLKSLDLVTMKKLDSKVDAHQWLVLYKILNILMLHLQLIQKLCYTDLGCVLFTFIWRFPITLSLRL